MPVDLIDTLPSLEPYRDLKYGFAKADLFYTAKRVNRITMLQSLEMTARKKAATAKETKDIGVKTKEFEAKKKQLVKNKGNKLKVEKLRKDLEETKIKIAELEEEIKTKEMAEEATKGYRDLKAEAEHLNLYIQDIDRQANIIGEGKIMETIGQMDRILKDNEASTVLHYGSRAASSGNADWQRSQFEANQGLKEAA